MNRLGAILFFIFSFGFGMHLAQESWDGVLYVYVGEWRSPSAIQGLRDFSSLRGTSLSSAAEFQFSSQSEVKQTEEGIEIHLNQFVMRDSHDRKNFVCRVEGRPGVFDRVELKLKGIGIAEAGKSPVLTLETDCESQPHAQQIGSIRIFVPMAMMYKLRPVDQHLHLYDDQNSFIRISQMTSEWPTEWRLQSVRYFSSENPQEMLTLLPSKKENPSKGVLSLQWPRTAEPAPQTF